MAYDMVTDCQPLHSGPQLFKAVSEEGHTAPRVCTYPRSWLVFHEVFYIFLTVQAQRRSKEHSRSTSALSGMADEKSEVSQDADHHMSLYSNGFMTSSMGNDPESPPQTSTNTLYCTVCCVGMSVFFLCVCV